ncbi:MAG TPA: hypothetical protein VFX65_08485 [Candidatus Limnocylindrales bacterium]|nr:hypothetical protein [Candidatus Limnocylindrales bacterium]
MPPLPSLRRDPWWGADGTAARRRRRRQRLVALVALVLALAAVAGAALGWAFQLGVAAGLGLPLDPFILP